MARGVDVGVHGAGIQSTLRAGVTNSISTGVDYYNER